MMQAAAFQSPFQKAAWQVSWPAVAVSTQAQEIRVR
jgi:hypothetical protein